GEIIRSVSHPCNFNSCSKFEFKSINNRTFKNVDNGCTNIKFKKFSFNGRGNGDEIVIIWIIGSVSVVCRRDTTDEFICIKKSILSVLTYKTSLFYNIFFEGILI